MEEGLQALGDIMAMKMLDPAENQDVAEPMHENEQMQLSRLTVEEQQRINMMAQIFGLDGQAVCDYLNSIQPVQNQDGTTSWNIPEGQEFDEDVVVFGNTLLYNAVDIDSDNTNAINLEFSDNTLCATAHEYILAGNMPVSIDRRTEQAIRQQAERLGLNGDNVVTLYRLDRTLSTIDEMLARNNISSDIQGNAIYDGLEDSNRQHYDGRETQFAAICGRNSRRRNSNNLTSEIRIANNDWRDITRAMQRVMEQYEEYTTPLERADLPRTGQMVFDFAETQGCNGQQVVEMAFQGLAGGQLAIVFDVDINLRNREELDELIDRVRPSFAGEREADFELATQVIRAAYSVWDVSQFSNGNRTLAGLVYGHAFEQDVTDADRRLFESRRSQFEARVANMGSGQRFAGR